MTETKTLLEMIETVDPNDTDKLDEINAHVYAFINGGELSWLGSVPIVKGIHGGFTMPSCYTTSRDALKAIRPEGWALDMTVFSIRPNANCEMHKIEYKGSFGNEVHTVGADFEGATEETAELYCIIQAIDWERNNGN